MDEKKEMSREEIIAGLREWLGPAGTAFFRDIKAKYGTLIACWDEGGIPHSVHFREGMQVRNQLRTLTNNSWTAHEYDDRWAELVEKVIEE
jgi:hypothetical protein